MNQNFGFFSIAIALCVISATPVHANHLDGRWSCERGERLANGRVGPVAYTMIMQSANQGFQDGQYPIICQR